MRCQGFKHGTGCKKTTRYPYHPNWKKRQLCYECDVILNAILYKDKPKRGTGGKYMKRLDSSDMMEQSSRTMTL